MSEFYMRSLNRSRKATVATRKHQNPIIKLDASKFAKIAAEGIESESEMKSEAFFAFHVGEKIEKTPVSSRVRTMINF